MGQSRQDDILEYAEREMRKHGIDAVSFRDIAAAIGIKSASVHYHFPTKADLTAAVTRRYTDTFLQSLGPADAPGDTPHDRLKRLAEAYIAAYETETSNCLCAVLGSVATHLPDATATEVRRFYQGLNSWITRALADMRLPLSPPLIISLLQGAMTLAVSTGTPEPLHAARAALLAPPNKS